MTPTELRKLMKENGWSQGDLQRLLPLKTTRTTRYWLTGKRAIRPVIAERIKSPSPERSK
jgi:hypothetical protein